MALKAYLWLVFFMYLVVAWSRLVDALTEVYPRVQPARSRKQDIFEFLVAVLFFVWVVYLVVTT
jgi:hypothetical protein